MHVVVMNCWDAVTFTNMLQWGSYWSTLYSHAATHPYHAAVHRTLNCYQFDLIEVTPHFTGFLHQAPNASHIYWELYLNNYIQDNLKELYKTPVFGGYLCVGYKQIIEVTFQYRLLTSDWSGRPRTSSNTGRRANQLFHSLKI